MVVYYDPVSDRIVGAVPGSWAYAHEERHREQYRRGWAQRVDMLHMRLYYAAFVAGPVGWWVGGWRGWFLGVGVAMTPHIVGVGLLELDAYVVGSWEWFVRRWLV